MRFPTGKKPPGFFLIIKDGLYNVAMAFPGILIRAKNLGSFIQFDAALPPKQFIHTITVDIHNRGYMASGCTLGIFRNPMVPARTHILVPSLDGHFTISSLGGEKYRFPSYETSHHKMTVGMGQALRARRCRPWPLPLCLPGIWVQFGKNVFSVIERMIRILIVYNPYFILPILIQVKSKNRAEPNSRNHSWPQILFPQLLTIFIKHY